MNIIERPRRLRATPAIRALVRENVVAPSSLVLPMFIREGLNEPAPEIGRAHV